MSIQLIICCPGRPAVNGQKRRSFIWNPTYNAYVFENRVLSIEEYNKIVDRVFDKNSDLRPRVKILTEGEQSATPPVATIAQEVTLDVALNVVARLAPHRLKAKSGPKPANMELAG